MNENLVAFALGFFFSVLSTYVQAMPSDSQKKAMKKACVDSKILETLVKSGAAFCPKSILNLKPNAKNVDPLVCVLSHKKHKDMSSECYNSALIIYHEIPSLFQPDIEGLD